MTVNYMQAAATARVGTFLKLLFRWRGSVWKTIWKELAIFLFLYFNVSIIYRFMLKGNTYGVLFERLVVHCRNLSVAASTVLSFAMGFYVSQVSDRWWKVFMTIPWPDSTAFQMCAFLRTRDEKKYEGTDRVIRKTIIRYLTLCYVLVFRDISERIRRRFPTYNHLVPSLMTMAEKSRIENEDIKRVYWMPIEWATQLLKKCYSRGQIDEYHFALLCESILRYREMMHNLLSFDWVNVPLVYTQVVHVCTVSYFGIICFSNQSISEDSETWINELVIPVFAIYEFIFFVGWLKVAQVMLNPFGMDDDDFDIDMLVERNLQIGYSYVDSMYDKLPPLIYVDVAALPHTKASMALITRANPMVGSVANVDVPRAEQQVISKADVEMIRKLVGPRFGRRFYSYEPSRTSDESVDKIVNSPQDETTRRTEESARSSRKPVQPANTPNQSREAFGDVGRVNKKFSSPKLRAGDFVAVDQQKKPERQKQIRGVENQHDENVEKTQSLSRESRETQLTSKRKSPSNVSLAVVNLGIQHTQKTAPNTLRDSPTTASTGGKQGSRKKNRKKKSEKLIPATFSPREKQSKNVPCDLGSAEKRKVLGKEKIKERPYMEDPTERSTEVPKMRSKVARRTKDLKKLAPKPAESLLSSATLSSVKTPKNHVRNAK